MYLKFKIRQMTQQKASWSWTATASVYPNGIEVKNVQLPGHLPINAPSYALKDTDVMDADVADLQPCRCWYSIDGGSRTEFNPGVGFEIFDDYFITREELRYTWISPDAARMQSHDLLIRNYHINSVEDGSLLSYHASPNWTFATKRVGEGHSV